jgi:hypothetical protein
LELGKGFIDQFQPKGFRAPDMFMKKEYLKVLKDQGFSYDTSIYSSYGIFSPMDNMVEFPVSTYPRFGGVPKYGFPRPLNINLLIREVPYGSGYYIGLLGSGVGKYIIRSNQEDRPANLFMHTWQVLEPLCETKVRGPGAKNRLLLFPYHKKREAALVALLENFKFVPIQTIIKDAKHG